MRDGVVVLQVRVAVKKPDDLAVVLEKRNRSGGDHRVGSGGRTARKDDADAANVVPLLLVAWIGCHVRRITFLLAATFAPRCLRCQPFARIAKGSGSRARGGASCGVWPPKNI